ncbi:hypothetical protein F4780DRAFT_779727 [Xylariomycetidae sp. FL0641]|nr:hypothetical protein F4780DRAFT_779727 [Xylariomycetidae sp. FL0641]
MASWGLGLMQYEEDLERMFGFPLVLPPDAGLGHSMDEPPTADSLGLLCMGCGVGSRHCKLFRCGLCNIIRCCSTRCQGFDWPERRLICVPRDGVRGCPVPTVDDLKTQESDDP